MQETVDDRDTTAPNRIGPYRKLRPTDMADAPQTQLNPEKSRWGQRGFHELYNMGHLLTAASVHRNATGKDSFVAVARKLADYLYDLFQPRPVELAHFGWNTQDAFVSILDLGETLFGLADAASGVCSPAFRRFGDSAGGRARAPQGSDSGPAEAGTTYPEAPRMGRDLMPLVGTSQRPDAWPQVAYGVYDLYNGMSFAVRAIRDERWTYVWNPQDVDELYDLEDDPHEMLNLASRAEFADQKARLRSQLMAWLEDIGDPLPDRAQNLPEAGTIIATGTPGP